MQIAIIGAGIGGLTAALCLHQQGFKVRIFERHPVLEEVGAGIQIGPNGCKVLRALGLLEQLKPFAFVPQAAEMRFGDTGKIIFSLPLAETSEQRYGAPYLNIHRADLQKVLASAIQQQMPDALQLGFELKDLTQDEQQVHLEFLNGQRFSADLVIGADGIRSNVRHLLFNIEDGHFTGMAAWRMTIPTERLAKNLVPPKATVWVGAHKHVVTYYLRGGALVNLVGVVEHSSWPYDGWTCQGSRQDILQDYQGWHPIIEQILQAGDDTEFYQWALREIKPLETWSSGRVTLLGDACHAMLPFMAQGAVMAIEDAWVLAQQLQRHPQQITNALYAYERLRKGRTSKVQATARRNGQLYHQSSNAGQMLFYSPLWLASRMLPDFFAKQLDWLFAEDVTR